MPSAVEAVEALIAEGVKRFYPAAVADQIGSDPATVARELEELVDRGDLVVRFDLVCGECGTTVASYKAGELIPRDEQIECYGTDDPHLVTAARENLWVSYSPTKVLADRVRHVEEPRAEEVAHRKRPRPWALMLRALASALKGMRSSRSTLRTSRSTSTKAREA